VHLICDTVFGSGDFWAKTVTDAPAIRAVTWFHDAIKMYTDMYETFKAHPVHEIPFTFDDILMRCVANLMEIATRTSTWLEQFKTKMCILTPHRVRDGDYFVKVAPSDVYYKTSIMELYNIVSGNHTLGWTSRTVTSSCLFCNTYNEVDAISSNLKLDLGEGTIGKLCDNAFFLEYSVKDRKKFGEISGIARFYYNANNHHIFSLLYYNVMTIAYKPSNFAKSPFLNLSAFKKIYFNIF
jgi:hypothetical protein